MSTDRSVLGLISRPPLRDSGSSHSEMPLERTSSLLDKADGAAFFRRSIAYQL
jgi:hypothetical protein